MCIISTGLGGGIIPAGLRDDFTFRAQVPAKSTKLVWKAYQTYADGTTVAWDQKPAAGHDEESSTSGPYSVTKITNDLTPAATASAGAKSSSNTGSLALSLLAVIIAVAAFSRQSRK